MARVGKGCWDLGIAKVANQANQQINKGVQEQQHARYTRKSMLTTNNWQAGEGKVRVGRARAGEG